jgi:hypothetical protein
MIATTGIPFIFPKIPPGEREGAKIAPPLDYGDLAPPLPRPLRHQLVWTQHRTFL